MESDAITREILDRYPAIASLPDDLWSDLLREARLVAVPAGSVLFEDHRACDAFPVILEGTVRVTKSAPNGRELQLYSVGPGESCILTTSCLLGNAPYSARGIADSPLSMVVLPRALFSRLVERHEPFRAYVFGLFSERLAELMRLVEEVAFRKLDQRLAAALLQKGRSIHATHQAIADELGSVREIISRLLKSFVDEGLVALSRERIDIVDAEGLRRIAAGPAPR